MSLRRLWVLVRGLPKDSSVVRHELGKDADWDLLMHRVTDIADLLLDGNQFAAGMAGAKEYRPERHFTRPGDERAEQAYGERLAAEAAEIRARKARERAAQQESDQDRG